MKKIALITQHQVFNYGSVLQTYATQKILEKNGFYVEIVDYISERWSNKKIFWDINYENKRAIKKVLYKIFRLPIVILRKVQFRSFVKRRLNLTQKYDVYGDLVNNPPKTDIYMVGSDQCWNSFYNGVDRAYYLQFGDKNKPRVSFSTSMGKEEFTKTEEKEIKNYLKDFSLISVREKVSIPLLEKITNKPIYNIIDPTLQLSAEEWNKIANSKRIIKEEYVLLFVLYDEDLNASTYARKLADEKNLKVVELSWQIKKKPGVDILMSHKRPEDFLALIRDAKYIVTNSFHGLAFSVIYNKEFIIVARSQFNNRIENLLNIVNLKNRLVRDSFDVAIFNDKIDYLKVNEIIKKEIRESNKFIEKINLLKS